MNFKNAIFDLDGTLLDTLQDIAESVNFALEKNTFQTHSHDKIKTFIGGGIHNLLFQACPFGTSDEKLAQVLSDYTAHYAIHKNDNTKPFDGIYSLLESLVKKGVSITILSNKPDKATKDLAKELFSNSVVYAKGATNDMPIKPDPSGVYHILEKTNALASETCFIGDSDVDIQTGKNAGLYTIGVSWGFRSIEELLQNGADLIAYNTEEIDNLF